MTKSPFKNAVLATGYITLVASLMYYGPKNFGPANTILVPIAMISLFVLSAAIMGYLFCVQPIQLYLDGAKKEAVNLFLKTIAVFGLITLTLFVLLVILA